MTRHMADLDERGPAYRVRAMAPVPCQVCGGSLLNGDERYPYRRGYVCGGCADDLATEETTNRYATENDE